jgi:hypothetical protein
LPWAHHRRVPPTEAARPKLSLKDDPDYGTSKASFAIHSHRHAPW